MHTPLSLPFIQ